jgi:protein TonB
MLDQLVESRNNSSENTRRTEFLLVTLVVLVSVLVGSWVYSLFNKDYAMGSGELDISSLVAPVALPEEAPPPPDVPDVKPQEKQVSNATEATVKEKVATMEQTTTPPKDVVGKKDVVGLDKSIADRVKEGTSNKLSPLAARSNDGDSTGGGLSQATKPAAVDDDEPKVEVKKATPPPTPKPAPKIVSGGVVNGKATNLVKPPYPAAARAVRADGAVNVQVTIDESGNVISASAVSGHPLLRAAAVAAARSSKFSPTMLSGQAVKVTGVIVYNFVP